MYAGHKSGCKDDTEFVESFKNLVDACNSNEHDETIFVLTKTKDNDGNIKYPLAGIPTEKISKEDELYLGITNCNKLVVK